MAGGKNIAQLKAQDEGSIQIIESGMTIAQLARAAKSKPETVRAKIITAGIEPCGERHGFPLYPMLEAAAVLAPPTPEFFEQYMRNASHHDLPPILTKEFWNGLKARASYEKDAGNLWETGQVMEGFGSLLKLVRMFVLTMPDRLERQTNLDPAQRKLVQDLCDNTLRSMQDAVHDLFGSNFRDEGDQPSGDVEAGCIENPPPSAFTADGALDPAWDL